MQSPRTNAPGREPAPTFRFACQRSGRCCTQGEGYVWLEDGELEALADAVGLAPETFAARFAREVVDAVSGRPRTSLREEQGRCVLLEGTRHCSAYAARPAQCRTFPRWPRVLSDPVAFESARSTCPGIAVVVSGERLARARARLTDWFETHAPGAADAPCPFADRGAQVWATGLEADVALAATGDSVAARAGDEERVCPFFDESGFHESGCNESEQGEATPAGSCRAAGARPLACRLAIRADVDEARSAELWRGLRALERELEHPAAFSRLVDLCASRRAPLVAGDSAAIAETESAVRREGPS